MESCVELAIWIVAEALPVTVAMERANCCLTKSYVVQLMLVDVWRDKQEARSQFGSYLEPRRQLSTTIEMASELPCLTEWSERFEENVVKAFHGGPQTLFLVEDSEQMTVNDGTRLVHIDGNVRFEECTRWEEVSAMLGMVTAVSKAAAGTTPNVRFLNQLESAGYNLGTEDTTYVKLLPRLAVMSLASNEAPLCRQIGMVAEELLQSNYYNNPSSSTVIVL